MTQASANARSQREELKWRRHKDQLKDRYIFRLEQRLSEKDLPLPAHPDGWDEDDEW